MDKVGQIESNNIPDRVQGDTSTGIGRGKYQYELSTGSGANKTASNRLFQSLSTLGISLDDIPVRDRQILIGEDPDFSVLSEDVQDLVFLADKFQAGDVDLNAIAKGDIPLKEAWLNTHWRGTEKDRAEKAQMWDNRFSNGVASNPDEPVDNPLDYDALIAEKAYYSDESRDRLYGKNSLFDVSNHKLGNLEESKKAKLERLGPKVQNANLSDSYTELADGRIISNRNKIHNEMSDAEYSSLWEYAKNNLALSRDDDGLYNISTGERYQGPVRRAYGYGTKTSDEAFKFGLSRGDKDSSDVRYTRWAPGPDGVDINKKDYDVLLPDYIGIAIEALGHGRAKALEGRLVKDALDLENYDRFGSGASEYYKSREAFFGNPDSADYGKAFNAEEARKTLYKYATQDYVKPYYKGTAYSDKEYLDTYTARVVEELAQNRYDNQTALDEGIQVLSALPAGVAKGALDLIDVVMEVATYIPQSIARAVTGNDKLDIDLFEDGFKKSVLGVVDNALGYDRKLDEITLNRAMEQITASGIDITSWESIKEAFTDPEKRSKLGSAAWTLLSDPSLTASMITEIIGSGGALGAISKTTAKVVTKVSPAFQKTVSNALQSNLSKLKVEVATATKAKDFARVKELQDSHTLLKKVPDLLKGSYYTNADMMVRMNNDITIFKENSNGEDPSADKIFGMAVLNRIASTAEVISLKSLVGMKDIPANVVKEATKKGLIRAAGRTMGSIVKGGVTEGVQETFDSVVEQINQKVGSADFEGKSVGEVLAETSAEILTGTFAGISSGVQLGGVKPASKLVSQGLGKVGQKVLDKKGQNTAVVEEAEVPETDLDAEALATVVTESNNKTNATISAYATMVDDDEYVSLIEAVGEKDQEDLATPILKEKLSNSDKTYAEIIEEVEAAEVDLESRKGTDKETENDEMSLRLFKKVKGEAAKSILESEKLPILGSGFSPEDVVEDFLTTKVNVEGNLDITEDEKALVTKFLKNNGQKPFRFDRIAKVMEGKDAYQVYEDSMASGANSAPNRRARLKKLVNTAGVSKKLISNEIEGISNFLNTQVTRKKLYEVAEKSLQTDIDAYNKNKNKPGASAGKPKKTMVEGLGTNYLDVQVDSKGNYKIEDSSRSILNSIDDNIDHLETTLNRYNKATTKILGTSSGSFLAVPVSSRLDKKIQGYREDDVKFYDKHKLTKVIVDNTKKSTSAKLWQEKGEYRVVNESKVSSQSTAFTAEDVVLLTTLQVETRSAVSKTLAAAIKAGATIVVDPSLLTTKNAKGKVTSNSIKIKTLAKRYNAGAINANGAIVFKPRAEVAAIQSEGRKEAQAKTREKAENILTLRT